MSNAWLLEAVSLFDIMNEQKRFEVLEGLPTYGPMYVPVSEDGVSFYSEGFVVRFYKSDGSAWVANFKPGWTEFCLVLDYPDTNRVVVIANGQGYIMNPDQVVPTETFGIDIREALQTENNKIILVDDLYVRLLDEKGTIWQSERISWDGMKDLKLEGIILTGLSYDPTDSSNEWIPFSIDLETMVIKGGSFRRYPID